MAARSAATVVVEAGARSGSLKVAQEAHRSGASVYDIVLKRKLMTREQLESVLRPEALTAPAPLDLAPRRE